MQELEKIIEEINDWISDYEESNHFGDFDQFIRGLKRARILIRAHMTEELSRENATETTRTSRDNWIPVEERLPGIGRKVLVSFRYTGWQPVIAFLSEEHRWLMLQGMKGYNDVTHDVSAWMPMPKTYHPKSEDWKENLLKKFDKRT